MTAYFLSNLLDVKPSYFIAWVNSPAAMNNLSQVDRMAEEGFYPVLPDLIPALYIAGTLCFIRWALHKSVFRVSDVLLFA